jgi:hypothetical protein
MSRMRVYIDEREQKQCVSAKHPLVKAGSFVGLHILLIPIFGVLDAFVVIVCVVTLFGRF